MRKQIPPFSGLQAFEATARHSSFTQAALELGITQAAVSHRIRHLEEVVGAKLFLRDGNSVILTEAAKDFLSSIRAVFSELHLATERLSNHDRSDNLAIASTGSFLIKCLIPILPIFRAQHPDIKIRILKLSSTAHQHPEYDVAIKYGRGELAGPTSERICREEVFPVCSPKLLEGPSRIRTPADLSNHKIIRVISPVIVWDEWPRWFDAAGFSDVRIVDEIFCDVLYPSFQAAIAGLGVVMGRNMLVKHDLDAGLLVEPFSTRLETDSGYYVTFSESAEREKRPIVHTFRNWLIETVQANMLQGKLAPKKPPATAQSKGSSHARPH